MRCPKNSSYIGNTAVFGGINTKRKAPLQLTNRKPSCSPTSFLAVAQPLDRGTRSRMRMRATAIEYMYQIGTQQSGAGVRPIPRPTVSIEIVAAQPAALSGPGIHLKCLCLDQSTRNRATRAAACEVGSQESSARAIGGQTI